MQRGVAIKTPCLTRALFAEEKVVTQVQARSNQSEAALRKSQLNASVDTAVELWLQISFGTEEPSTAWCTKLKLPNNRKQPHSPC